MLSYREALDIILSLPFEIGQEDVPLLKSEGHRLAGPVQAPWPLPRFDNSSMDGYALKSADVQKASAGQPVSLEVIGESAAGTAFTGEVHPGQCIRISTGAEVPPSTDTIVPIERVDAHDSTARFSEPAPPDQFIRRLGTDVEQGAQLFQRGTLITPEVLAFLAYYNLPKVAVLARPRVGILTGGDEIRHHGEELSGSQIVGSSIYYLEREIARCGCEPRLFGIARDDFDDYRKLFVEMLEWSDLIVTTAGVSVGDHDIVGPVIESLGGQTHFWRAAVRPGKPILLASYGRKHHFGFPGNPVSTCCNTEIFLKPFLRKAFGIQPIEPPRVAARLETDCPRDRKRLFFVYAQTRIDESGRIAATPLPNQNSGNLLNPALADAMLEIEPGMEPVPKGSEVKLIPLQDG